MLAKLYLMLDYQRELSLYWRHKSLIERRLYEEIAHGREKSALY